MRKNTEVTVDGVTDVLPVTQIQGPEVLTDALERLIADVGAPGLDEGSEELHSVTHVTDMQLTHVQLQAELIHQELTDLRYDGEQPAAVGADDIGVIDIPTVVAGSDGTLHELVKDVEIDVAVELGGEVTEIRKQVFP